MADDQFTLLGDAVWLDFINTAQGRTAPPPDLLSDFDGWRRWSITRKLDPGTDPSEFPTIRRFRDQLTVLAEALHAERPPPGGSIAAMNALLTRRSGSERLMRVNGQWRLQFAPTRSSTALESIARSAAGTLTDGLSRVRRCAGQQCSLFFTDQSPTGSRRWCEAEVCGRDRQIERRRGAFR